MTRVKYYFTCVVEIPVRKIEMNKILIIIGAIAIALGIFNFFMFRRRSKSIEDNAKKLGIDFKRSSRIPKTVRKLNFTMLRLGPGLSRSKNILTKNYIDMKISIFDHEIRNTRWTCFLITFSNKVFPNFNLYPNKVGIKSEMPLFKYKKIQIENGLDFSKKYALYSDAPDSIKTIFNPDLTFFIYGLDSLNLEGRDNTLLFYQDRVRLDEKRIEYYFDYAKSIALKFLQNN